VQLSTRQGIAVAVVVLVAGVWVAGGALRGSAAATATFTPPSGPTFQPEPVLAGMISEQKAISVALHYSEGAFKGKLLPGVHVRAYFGLYTDTIYTARPVWILRFWGPGLKIYPLGGPMPRPGTPYCAPPEAHEELVVIGAKTGKYLEADVGAHSGRIAHRGHDSGACSDAVPQAAAACNVAFHFGSGTSRRYLHGWCRSVA
jgi:hypothetical protein